jgi:hypothetical protein
MAIPARVNPQKMFADVLAGSARDARSQVRNLFRMRSILEKERAQSLGQIWGIRRLWLILPGDFIKFGENLRLVSGRRGAE